MIRASSASFIFLSCSPLRVFSFSSNLVYYLSISVYASLALRTASSFSYSNFLFVSLANSILSLSLLFSSSRSFCCLSSYAKYCASFCSTSLLDKFLWSSTSLRSFSISSVISRIFLYFSWTSFLAEVSSLMRYESFCSMTPSRYLSSSFSRSFSANLFSKSSIFFS